jgi:hypothetical protein
MLCRLRKFLNFSQLNLSTGSFNARILKKFELIVGKEINNTNRLVVAQEKHWNVLEELGACHSNKGNISIFKR